MVYPRRGQRMPNSREAPATAHPVRRVLGPARRAAVVTALAALVALPAPAAAAADATTLTRDRVEIVTDLARPIAECLARRDTEHAAFHGCIDWHSAVHAAWALSAYTR